MTRPTTPSSQGARSASRGVTGTAEQESAAVKSTRAPLGKRLYFGAAGRLYEFRNGSHVTPTWPNRRGSNYYAVGDIFGKQKVNRRILLTLFETAQLPPQPKATVGHLMLLLLDGVGEEFTIGNRIVSVRRRGRDAWEGELSYQPFFVHPDTKKKIYGPVVTLGGERLQTHFRNLTLGSLVDDAAQGVQALVQVTGELLPTLTTGGAKNGIKALGRSFRNAQAVNARWKTRRVATWALKKAASSLLSLLVLFFKTFPDLLDTTAIKAITTFAFTLSKALLKDAGGRCDVLVAAASQATLPCTVLTGKTGKWVIDWQTAFVDASVAGASSCVESLLSGYISKELERRDKKLEAKLTAHGLETLRAHVQSQYLEKKLRELVYNKLLLTDNYTFLLKVVAAAAQKSHAEAKPLYECLAEVLREKWKERFKDAVIESLETFLGSDSDDS